MADHNESCITCWPDLRIKTGVGARLSNVHCGEDLAQLLNLVNFAADAELDSGSAVDFRPLVSALAPSS